jgi:uncharacterized protein involved in tolerance to divalent cations
MTSNFCQLWLTCTNKEEADKISETLLAKHLVACVRQTPVISNFHWQGKTESANEAMMRSRKKSPKLTATTLLF